jgi:hypothetical protein
MPTQTFKVGEMLNKRTLNSKTWINFDGSYTTEIYNGPVHYQDENGNLHNIDTDLYDEADLDQIDFPVAREGADVFRMMKNAVKNMKKKNILDRDSLDFQGLKVPFDCRIPKNFKRGYVIGKGQNRLRFIPIGVSPTKGFLDENQKNRITYQDPWNDTDVTLEVLPNGIKETIILKSSESPTKFTFEVDGPLEDDLTSGNLKLQPAWLQDANGEKRDVSQTIRREGDKTFIDLVADVTGLTYPIEIDPTVTIQPDGTQGKDTFIDSNNPNANFGTWAELFSAIGGTPGNGRGTTYMLFQFDLSTIPEGVDITQANLSLYSYEQGNSNRRTFKIQPITTDWIETSVAWNGQPSVNSADAIFITEDPFYNAIYHDFDITNIVKKWLDGEIVNRGIRVEQTGDYGGTGIWVRFYSSDSTINRPKLTVIYNLPPTAPTLTSPNGGETWNSVHTIQWVEATDKIDQYTNLQKITTNKTQTLALNCQGAGQSFKVNSTDFIYKVAMYVSATPSQKLKAGTIINLRYFDEATPERGEIISTYTLPNDVTNSGFVYAEFDNPQSFPLDTSLAVEFVNPTGLGANILGSSGVGQTGKNYYIDSSGSIFYRINDPFELEVYYGQPSPLQYQIQLTTDNGQSWKDIVSLTAPGATSYQYDFINEPETSLAKIRIRAYDGTSYGPWDESDGVFTIQHNQAPTVPTNLSPSGGTPKDRASVIRLSWQHNDANGDPQAQFDLQWRLQGAQTWNTVSQVTPNQYWDAPAGTFPKGTIEWQVRTYDQAGLSSPYSDIQKFFAGDKPANPTITDPTNGATVPVANPTVQWSSVGQTAYHVKLLDINNNLLWEVQSNSTNKAQTILYDLQNNTDYKIQVAIKNADNLWSDFVTSNIHVSYTPPAVPIVTTTKGEATITISIDNPTPQGTEPNVSYNSVFRRKQGESTWTRIATNIPADGSFTDYTPASDQVYEYYVRAWGDNGTYSDSSVVSESVSFIGVWIHEADNPLNTLHQFKLVSDRSENWQPTASLMQFAGRRLPVAEYDDAEQRTVSVKLSLLKDSNDREALESLICSKNTLCYRDARGRKMFCHAFQLPIDDELYGNTVSLTFEEVSYTEEV